MATVTLSGHHEYVSSMPDMTEQGVYEQRTRIEYELVCWKIT